MVEGAKGGQMRLGGTGLSVRHKDGGSGHQCAPGTVQSHRELGHWAKVSYSSWTQWREYRRRSVWSPSGCGEVKLGYEGPTGRVSTM